MKLRPKNAGGVSLKVWLVSMLMLFAVLPLVAVTIVGNSVLTENLKNLIFDSKKAAATAAAREIESYISHTRLALSNFSGQELVHNFAEPEAQQVAIKNLQEHYPQLQYVYVMDRDGKVRNVSPREGWNDWDFGDRDWFKQVMSSGEPYLSGSFISNATNQPMVFTVYPLKNPSGELVGAVGANIDLERISKTINALKVGKTGYAFAIDGNGVITVHPNHELVLKQEKFENELAQEALAGKTGSGEYIIDGKKKVAAYAPVESLGWGVFFTQDRAEAMAAKAEITERIILILIISIILAIALGYVLSDRIARSLKELVSHAEVLAQGDFTREIEPKGMREERQLGLAFKRMQESLRSLIKQANSSSQNLAASSEQLAKAAEEVGRSAQQVTQTVQQMAAGSQEQAGQTNEIMGYVADMAQSITGVNTDIQEVNKRANVAKEEAMKGRQHVQQSVAQMELITNKVDETAKAIKGLDERSGKISEIVNLITGIAEQTNLLALNAAIEAARAGEQGRGFAVVAEEVRKLAEESANAARQIAQLIKEVQNETKQCVAIMNESIDEVSSGTEIINQAEQSFEEIAKVIEELNSKITGAASGALQIVEMAAKAKEGIENIAAIGQQAASSTQEVAASAEEQSASVEEIVSSVEELARMAQELQDEIKAFKV
ncbi:methyl-accepting chemotaxis protein [Zhaonella formicivorans]|uniref:methyl-accepting chemotaxis protein n=1 Tax=Zhaonella formicivorans TaxID=2528593 RepID=UPI0010F20BA9|nr:methyl-accepting chemotaxis protein [Zhaonella formicivorans]